MGTLVNDKECSVCLTEILGNYTDDGQKPKSLPCKHTFHTACVDQWIRTKPSAAGACPECRGRVALAVNPLTGQMFLDQTDLEMGAPDSTTVYPANPTIRMTWEDFRVTPRT